MSGYQNVGIIESTLHLDYFLIGIKIDVGLEVCCVRLHECRIKQVPLMWENMHIRCLSMLPIRPCN